MVELRQRAERPRRVRAEAPCGGFRTRCEPHPFLAHNACCPLILDGGQVDFVIFANQGEQLLCRFLITPDFRIIDMNWQGADCLAALVSAHEQGSVRGTLRPFPLLKTSRQRTDPR